MYYEDLGTWATLLSHPKLLIGCHPVYNFWIWKAFQYSPMKPKKCHNNYLINRQSWWSIMISRSLAKITLTTQAFVPSWLMMNRHEWTRSYLNLITFNIYLHSDLKLLQGWISDLDSYMKPFVTRMKNVASRYWKINLVI